MKVTDLINSKLTDNRHFYSFEYFPPKTDQGLYNLYSRLDVMVKYKPLFINITWPMGGQSREKTIELCKIIQSFYYTPAVVHVASSDLDFESAYQLFSELKEHELNNVFIIGGDTRKKDRCFPYALDLIKYVTKEFGSYFTIGVAAYPEGHQDNNDMHLEIDFLQKKIDAGANWAVTQLFYEAETFFHFIGQAKEAGIRIPILPGILPIQSYAQYKKIFSLSNAKVPADMDKKIHETRHDDEQVKKIGIESCTNLCRKLLNQGVNCIHFFTMNLETTVLEIINRLPQFASQKSERELPWRTAASVGRKSESVRPIFWSNRPHSYLSRTSTWDDFPNGRWGDSRSPAFDSHSASYFFRPTKIKQQKVKEAIHSLGPIEDLRDVHNIFANFCSGKTQFNPWTEDDIAKETAVIADMLVQLNRVGILTINSQPQVNGEPSTHPVFGWGGDDGIVYQKSYLEFFIHPKCFYLLKEYLDNYPSISYQAVDCESKIESNVSGNYTNAVTWGAFPNREIIQPTIVDAQAFLIWKNEAFDIWKSGWGDYYPEGSPSRNVLDFIRKNYFLVNIVENNYVTGNIYAPFNKLINSGKINDIEEIAV